MRLASLFLAFALLAPAAAFSQETASEGLEEHIVAAALPRGAQIRGLASKRAGTNPTRVALLFVGSPGILRLEAVDGQPRYQMKGNFLARARRHLNTDTVMTVLVDCPTDQWDGCDASYRRSAQHAEDVGALMAALTTELGPVTYTVVGTSYGTVSSANLARNLPALAGAVHTSTFAGSHKSTFAAGMSGFDWSAAKVPQLFVHHQADPCFATPYQSLRAGIGALPLTTVVGSKNTEGPACEALSEHGFRGREREVMQAIAGWITDGTVIPLLGQP